MAGRRGKASTQGLADGQAKAEVQGNAGKAGRPR